mmetsp:Transcript_17702/g.43236  ORF Transcript_17702/g.43236 Transcript_17702/m.43236 type:complete len:213 (-) Transcript_17702:719-1357(-)
MLVHQTVAHLGELLPERLGAAAVTLLLVPPQLLLLLLLLLRPLLLLLLLLEGERDGDFLEEAEIVPERPRGVLAAEEQEPDEKEGPSACLPLEELAKEWLAAASDELYEDLRLIPLQVTFEQRLGPQVHAAGHLPQEHAAAGLLQDSVVHRGRHLGDERGHVWKQRPWHRVEEEGEGGRDVRARVVLALLALGLVRPWRPERSATEERKGRP